MYVALWVCNGLAPQLMWFKRFRTSPFWLFVVAMFVNVGMWLERFVIIPASLHRDFLPSSWGMYHGTFWDWSFYIGSIGLFFALLFLFVRFLPMISIFEMRTLLPEAQAHAEARRSTDAMAIGKIREGLYGVIAEFNDPQTLLDAANAVREAGYTDDRRLLAVPDPRPGRGGRVPQVAPLD